MQPGNLLPANGSEQDRNLTSALVDFAKESQRWFFTVGQPEDPNASHNLTYRYSYLGHGATNVSDMSTLFLLRSHLAISLLLTQESARGYFDQEMGDLNKKWRIGVGVAVGLGVPLVAAIMFCFGSKMGEKKAKRRSKLNSDNMELHEG